MGQQERERQEASSGSRAGGIHGWDTRAEAFGHRKPRKDRRDFAGHQNGVPNGVNVGQFDERAREFGGAEEWAVPRGRQGSAGESGLPRGNRGGAGQAAAGPGESWRNFAGSSPKERTGGGKVGSKGPKSGGVTGDTGGANREGANGSRVGGMGGSSKTSATQVKDSEGRSGTEHSSPSTDGRPNVWMDGVSEGDVRGDSSAESMETAGRGIMDFDFGRWFSQDVRWPDPEPALAAAGALLFQATEKVQAIVQFSWPLIKRWSWVVSRAMIVLCFLSLECGIRGVNSLVRLGSSALFLLVWCTAFNLAILAGISSFGIALGLSLAAGFFLRYTPALGLVGLYGVVMLWMHGSFWTTGLFVLLGGGLFIFDHARKGILITMLYSVYSTWGHGGWTGLMSCTVLAFISSDVVIYILSGSSPEGKNGTGYDEKSSRQAHEQGSSKYGGSQHQSGKGSRRTGGSSGPHTSSKQRTSTGYTASAFGDAYPGNEDTRTFGGASTAGPSEGDPSADEEVARVLRSSDHYAVLGFARYDNVEVSILKREYKKLAMLVHPDKNRGNERAEEAFKRLQNAYEVLLDTIKRKVYDDDLKREDFLETFRKHRQGPHQGGRNQSSNCGCPQSEDEAEDDIPADSRRIACKRCNDSHVWISTTRARVRARWCQECQEYHQAKDGDGWVEQSSQSFFFGMFQKVDVPRAYACADGKVYDVTDWVICQGMKCPVNTHKPTFHVSTAGVGKSTPARGGPSRSSRGATRPPNMAEGFPFGDYEDNAEEHEFFDWLEAAMNAGMFGDFDGIPAYPGGRAPPKGAKQSRKKRKGKRSW